MIPKPESAVALIGNKRFIYTIGWAIFEMALDIHTSKIIFKKNNNETAVFRTTVSPLKVFLGCMHYFNVHKYSKAKFHFVILILYQI